MWIDSKNYTELTRPWYAGVLPLPLNWIVPGRIASHVRHVLTEDSVEYDDDSVESKVSYVPYCISVNSCSCIFVHFKGTVSWLLQKKTLLLIQNVY